MSESNGSLAASVDRLVGDGVEAAVRAKHSWRLRRLGWHRAIDPPAGAIWASGDPPPRSGCSLDVLIDGADAFPAIAEAIEHARDHVHVTGWHVAPYFELVRGERPSARWESCWPRPPSGSTSGCSCGPVRPCPPFTPPARRCAKGSRS